MPPKKINRIKRVKRQPKQIKSVVSTRDVDVGFGGVPISAGALQQSQNQQIFNTIGNTNQLIGRLKAQQISIENELERVKKQTGAKVNDDFIKEKNQLKLEDKTQSKIDDYYSLEPKLTVNRLDSRITMDTDRSDSKYNMLKGKAEEIASTINPDQDVNFISFAINKNKKIEELETNVKGRTRPKISQQFREAEAGSIITPSYLQPLSQINRTREISQEETTSQNLSQQVAEEINKGNEDFRGFSLRK